MSEATDPWAINYFDPPSPHVAPPSPKATAPKLLPDIDRLFQVQRNSLKVLRDLQAIRAGKEIKPADLHRLEQDAENTYRVIRSYLDKHSQ